MVKKIFLIIVMVCIIITSVSCGYNYWIYGCFFIKKVTTDECLNDNWETVLVNNKHCLEQNYEPMCTKLSNGESVDERIYPQLQNMFDDARKDGISITVRSGYRSWDEQEELWEQEKDRIDEEGIRLNEAVARGEITVQRQGMSEHQTGLAVDINSLSDGNSSNLYDWLRDYSYKYGFVLRYPENKIEITGISYEPWHFRYVGVDAAKVMKDEDICLEEYVKRYH